MDDTIYKIFELGIYGGPVNAFTDTELNSVLFHPTTELLTQRERDALLKKYDTVSFYDSTQRILAERGIHKSQGCDGRKLQGLFIKLNAVEWKDMAVSNLYPFKRVDYYPVLNRLVQSDYVKYADINNGSRIQHRVLVKFFTKLVSVGYLKSKTVNDELFYGINRVNGRVVTPVVKEGNTIPSVTEKKIVREMKAAIDVAESGVLNRDFAAIFEIPQKTSLRILQKICSKNVGYTSTLEVDGKIKRLRFFTVEHYEAYKKRDKKDCILRDDKIQILHDFIQERKPFIADRRIIVEYAEKIKSRYVPDIKNFKKLVAEAGFKVLTVNYFDNNLVKQIVCDKAADEEAVKERFKPKSTKRFEAMGTHNDMLYRYFVSVKRFIEMDNGYIGDANQRLAAFVDFLAENGDKTVVFDKEFIYHMKLKDFFKFVPYHFYLKERGEVVDGQPAAYLYESDDARSEGIDVSHDFSFDDLIRRQYNNLEFLKLKYTLVIWGFKVYFDRLQESGYSVEKTQRHFKIDLSVAHEIDRSKPCQVPYIPFEKRMAFYNMICTFEIKSVVSKIQSLINESFVDSEHAALIARLVQFKRNFKHDKSDRPEVATHATLNNLYIALKKLIMTGDTVEIATLKEHKSVEFTKAVALLKNNRVIKSTLDKSTLVINEAYGDNFKVMDINTVFPLDYFWHGLARDDNSYVARHFGLIAYYLILNGTYEIKKLLHKVVILERFEFDYITSKYKEFIRIEVVNGMEYVSIVLPDSCH